jgi:hypothetical protein
MLSYTTKKTIGFNESGKRRGLTRTLGPFELVPLGHTRIPFDLRSRGQELDTVEGAVGHDLGESIERLVGRAAVGKRLDADTVECQRLDVEQDQLAEVAEPVTDSHPQ